MSRRILLVGLVACAALLVLLGYLSGDDARDEAAPTPEAVAEAREPAAVDAPPVDPTAAAEPSATRAEAAPAPDMSSQAPGAPEVDKKARDWVHLIVQDRYGAPVANAEIRMIGLRTKRDRGSHWSWPEEPSIGRTARDGTAKLWHPVWVNSDDETGELTFTVTHPDFVTKTVDLFKIGPEPRVVVLQHGAFLVVSGWIDSPSEVITDVVPHLTWDVRVTEDAWQPIRDGRLSTANIPVGTHAIYLSHSSTEHGVRFSAVTTFTLEEDEQEELYLELLPARRLEGRLEDEVPRPVENGEVLLNLLVGSDGGRQVTMLREFKVPIREDGTFTFVDLPPGDGQIIALCDGWAAERASEELPGSRVVGPGAEQGVDPASPDVFVLKMEPTAALEATVRGPDGEPVRGATLSCWPNVFWRNGYSNIYLERTWSATSDASGKLVVPNMPRGSVWYGVVHADLDLPLVDGSRNRQGELEPGGTLEVVLDLVKKEP